MRIKMNVKKTPHTQSQERQCQHQDTYTRIREHRELPSSSSSHHNRCWCWPHENVSVCAVRVRLRWKEHREAAQRATNNVTDLGLSDLNNAHERERHTGSYTHKQIRSGECRVRAVVAAYRHHHKSQHNSQHRQPTRGHRRHVYQQQEHGAISNAPPGGELLLVKS